MLDRRTLLASAVALVALPAKSPAQLTHISFKVPVRQGELIVGRTEPGTVVRLDDKNVPVSVDGYFAFGLPYDQKATSVLEAHFPDGAMERREVTPSLREYEIQRISGLPESFVNPPAEILDRIKSEAESMRNARERVTVASWFADGFDWPAPGIISSLFGSQRILNGQPRAPHLAIDIAAPMGTRIQAPAAGIVSFTGDLYFDGLFTILDHGQGVSTCYAHQSRILVNPDDKIARGQTIGEVGSTGRVTGPNLHWGMNWFQVGLDPSLSANMAKPPKA